MKYIVQHILPLFLLLFCASAVAQVSVRSDISRDNILIGESISLTVEAYMPMGSDVTWFLTDTIPHFEILRKSGVDTVQNIDTKKLSQNFEITSFDSGQQYIPPFTLRINDQVYSTDSIPINVSFAPFDPKEDYHDIKDIIDVKNPSLSYLQWIIIVTALLSLVAVILLWRKRKSASAPVKIPVQHLLSPYEEAMKALAQLSKKQVTNGEVKTFYSDMNDILRKYVSRKFSVSTFERTNEELIMELSRLGSIPKDSFISLAQSLRMSDFVKFAKYRPAEEENRKNLKIVTSSIEILDQNFNSAV